MQKIIDGEKDIDERRKYGQFATPFALAQEIVKYGLHLLSETNISFLEPCIGSGSFYSALLSEVNNDHCIQNATGIEIDPVYYGCATKVWKAVSYTHLDVYKRQGTHTATAFPCYMSSNRKAVLLFWSTRFH